MINLINDILNGGNSISNIRRAACAVDARFLPRLLLGLIKRNPCPSPESIVVLIEILDDSCSLKPPKITTIDSYAICELFQILSVPLTNNILRSCMNDGVSLVDVLHIIPMDDSVNDVIDVLLTMNNVDRLTISNAIRNNKHMTHDDFMEMYDRAYAKKILLGGYIE